VNGNEIRIVELFVRCFYSVVSSSFSVLSPWRVVCFRGGRHGNREDEKVERRQNQNDVGDVSKAQDEDVKLWSLLVLLSGLPITFVAAEFKWEIVTLVIVFLLITTVYALALKSTTALFLWHPLPAFAFASPDCRPVVNNVLARVDCHEPLVEVSK
jgi:hypothetical protein